jgi:hypothetical protein
MGGLSIHSELNGVGRMADGDAGLARSEMRKHRVRDETVDRLLNWPIEGQLSRGDGVPFV